MRLSSYNAIRWVKETKIGPLCRQTDRPYGAFHQTEISAGDREMEFSNRGQSSGRFSFTSILEGVELLGRGEGVVEGGVHLDGGN